MAVKPFVKWAGGKGQLLVDIRKKYPQGLGENITKYCEPFVGGGAVLLDVLSNYTLDEVLINDMNKELMNTYAYIQSSVDDLIDELQHLQSGFWSMDMDERKKDYYIKRNRFNELKLNGDEKVNLEKAGLFIFLNKTCFNGLFRVNKKGLFNVPIGSYKMPPICDAENLQSISKLLRGVIIKCADYRECLTFIDERTFVYIDPPYRPLTKTASFTSYVETLFDDREQMELERFMSKINDVGAKAIISNADPKNNDEKDNFFDELYKPYIINRVLARRMINCNGKSRGNISELLISNY